MSRAKIKTEIKVSFNEIKIGDYTLSDILYEIRKNAHDCLEDISIERQKINPNLEDIDVGLHRILNLLDEIQ